MLSAASPPVRLSRTGIAIAALAAIVGWNGAAVVNAQDATPAPVVCEVEPRPADFLVDMIHQPAPETTPDPLKGVPVGSDQVDPETRADVIAVLQELTACVNAGEVSRAFSLFDDAYIRRLVDPEGLMTDAVALELGQSLATPSAVGEEDRQTVDEILLVRQLADGSIAIVFRSRIGEVDESQIDLLVMREIDGRWLIVDGLTDLDPDDLPSRQ